MYRRVSNLVLPIALALPLSAAYGQNTHRYEIGGQATALQVAASSSGCGACPTTTWAIGSEVTFNVKQTFAFDAGINYFPRSSGSSEFAGGRLTQLLVGAKASIRSPRFTMFVKGRPGLLSWSDATTALQFPDPTNVSTFKLLRGRRNFFAFNFSGGFEYALTPRVGISTELGDTIVRYTNLSGIAQFRNNLQSSMGMHYRFGGVLGSDSSASQATHNFFDRGNVALIGISLLAQTADAITTQRRLANCERNPLPSDKLLGCAAQEGNPIARPFVTHGWGGQIALGGIVNAAEIAVMYGMHRMGHHRVERVPPVAMSIGSGVNAYRNLQP